MSSILRDPNSRYYQARGRDNTGHEYQVSTKIPVEPDPLTTPPDQLSTRRLDLEYEAKRFAEFTEAFRQNRLNQMEYDTHLATLKFRQVKIQLPEVGWVITCWLWEHLVRNRLTKDKSARLILLVDRLLGFLRERQELSSGILRASPCFLSDFMLRMRLGDWGSQAPLTLNNYVLYLKKLDRDLGTRFKKQPDPGLEYEEVVYARRFSLPQNLLQQLLDHISYFGAIATEWLLFLLLCACTPYRPNEVKRLKWKDIYGCPENAEIHLIALKPFRGTRLTARQAWVIAPFIWELLQQAQGDPNRPQSEYLLPTLQGRSSASLSVSFLSLMKHAGITPKCISHEISGRKVNQYGLYSLRRAFNVAAFREARVNYAMGRTWHQSATSQTAYLNDLDPEVLASQLEDLKKLPVLKVQYLPYPPAPKPSTKKGMNHEI